MNRFLLVVLMAFLAVSPGLAHADVMLRPSVTINDNVIRLGDLFKNAGSHAKDPVAPAPPLGMRVTYSASWLDTVAHQYGLSWTPASYADQATVVRASRVIGPDAISERLLQAMSSSINGQEVQLHLDNPGLQLLIPADASDAIAVNGLTLDQRSGRFSAFVSAPAGAADATRQRVTGQLVFETEIAVPNHTIAAGEVLTPGDIEEIKIARDRLGTDAITDPSQLIGKSARQLLAAHMPIRQGDVRNPIVVHKSDLVTIELITPTMQLTAQGKALEDGSMGADIRVANTLSKRPIDAAVIGPNLVRVDAPGQIAVR